MGNRAWLPCPLRNGEGDKEDDGVEEEEVSGLAACGYERQGSQSLAEQPVLHLVSFLAKRGMDTWE